MTTQIISSGVTSSGLSENFGDELIVLGGGIGSATSVTGGLVSVSSGGSTVSTTVSSGGGNIGQEIVSSGGSTTGTVVLSGGVETVLSGGSAVNAIVSGGFMQLGTPAFSGFLASAGGTATGTVIDGGGAEAVRNGGVDSGAHVVSGIQSVESGGLSISATASATTPGGLATVQATGGVVSAATIGSGGLLSILSGGVVIDETILAGGAVNIENAGTYTLSAGRTAQNISIQSGGAFNLLGTASAVSVASGGVETVSSGGLLTGNASSYNGVFGTLNVLAGGAADHLFIDSGGTARIAGVVNGFTNVNATGGITVSSGGLLTGNNSAGNSISGTLNVLAGGAADHLFIASGATAQIAGTTNGFTTVAAGGVITVSAGGNVSGASGSGTGLQGIANVLSGGAIAYAGISGGTLNLSADGTGHHLTVSNGGRLNVAGTTLSNVAISAGGVETVLSGGLISGASGSGTGVSGGTLNVLAGGSAAFVGVYGGGVFNLQGTVLGNMSIVGGGIVNVSAGGVISGATNSGTTVSSGGSLNVLAGGSVDHVKILNRGYEMISSGGSGAHLNIAGGTLELAGGANVNGVMFSAAGGVLKLDVNSMPGLTINGFGAGNFIDLASANYVGGATASVVSGNILRIVEGAQTYNITLNSSEDFSGKTFRVNSDPNGGTYVSMIGEQVSNGQVITVSSGQTSNGLEVQSGGLVTVQSGGLAAATIIGSGGVQNNFGLVSASVVQAGGLETIQSGGRGSFLTVSGQEVISSGGIADHIGVYSGGLLTVLGTVDYGTTVYAGGVETVSSGGLVTGQPGSGTAISGGIVNVLSGANLDHATTFSGGVLNISAGAQVFNIAVSSGSTANLAGTITSNVNVGAGGLLTVSSGGVLAGAVGSGTTDFGTINVLDGGSADHVTMFSGGVFNLSSGAVGHDLLVSSGGLLNVAGTVISNVVISGGGVENVLSGGSITGQVYSGSGDYGTSVSGTLNILAGGTAAFLGVSSGGALNVAGTVTSHVALYSGGTITISSGGVVTGVSPGSGTAISGGIVNVRSGGSFDHFTAYPGGILNLSAGAIAHDFTLSSGGVANVAGTVTSNALVSSGGIENILSGGRATGTTVLSGGVVAVKAGGTVIGSMLSSGGVQTISAGGSGSGNTILDGGRESVAGSEQGTTVAAGTLDILAGGTAHDLTVSSGGALNVAGTVTSNVTLLSGAVETVSSGGVVTGGWGSGTFAAGATINVLSGGAADHISLASGGLLNASGGAAVHDIAMSDSIANVLAGAVGHDFNLSSGSYLNVAGTVTSNFQISSGAAGTVSSGGVVASGTIAGGTLDLLSGARADHFGVTNGGAVNISAGGVAYNFSVSSGAVGHVAGTVTSFLSIGAGGDVIVSSGGQVTGTSGSGTLVSGTIDVLSGGSFDHAAIVGGGTANVSAGGIAFNLLVSSGGNLNVAGRSTSSLFITDNGVVTVTSGGLITGAAGSGTSISGGTLNVLSSGAADHITISSGGNLNVAVGGVAHDMTVSSGGHLNVAGSVTSNVVLAGGTEYVSSGGSAGATSIAGGILEVADGGTISGDVTFIGAGGVYRIHGTTMPTSVIRGLATGNEIDLADINFTAGGTASLQSGGTILHIVENSVEYNLNLDGTMPSNLRFGLIQDSGSGVLITLHENVAPTVALTSATIVGAHGQTSLVASSLFTASDSDGDTITQYGFWDREGNGFWSVNGAAQGSMADIIVDAADLSQVSYTFGAAMDTLFIRAFDGTTWSAYTQFTATPGPNAAPIVTASNLVGTHDQTSVAAAGMFSASDPDGDTITKYAFSDQEGNGHWIFNGVPQTAEFIIDAADLSQVSYTFGAAMDTLSIRAFDGTTWGAYKQFTATPGVNAAPIVTVSNVVGVHNQAPIAASTLFSASDPDGDTITKYIFWDREGNGSWTINGVPQAKLTDIVVDAADLSQVSYTFGAAMDTLFIRAFDGTTWSAYTQFTATPGPNAAPIVTASNLVGTHDQTSVAAAGMFSASDPDGDTITKYAFSDQEGNGHWIFNGVPQTAEFIIDAADLSQVSYTFGSAMDTLSIRAFDGTAWGAYKQFTATQLPNRVPIVTVSNVVGVHNQAPIAASMLFTASDPDGDTITKYIFWDREGNGSWTINGVPQAKLTDIVVDAADLSQVSYTFGAAMDTLFIRAFDGTTWSAYTQFTATPGPNAAPIVTVSNVVGVHNQAPVAASTLFTASDPDGDTITKYIFWDREGNGSWTINGVPQGALTDIVVDAADLSQVSYTFGAAMDTLFIRAFDGTAWSAYTQFTATPGPNAAPIVTVSNVVGVHNQAPIAASTLFSASDPDGDTITKYIFWDREGNGSWTINGVPQGALTDIVVDAANLSQVTYTFGAAMDTLFIRAFDGTTWGAYTQFTATPGANAAPIVTASNLVGTHNQSVSASQVISAFDPDGDTITQYGFWDREGYGHWTVNGVAKGALTDIVVNAADLAQVSYAFGSAMDTLFVRAFDGTTWGAYKQFTATPRPNQAPVVTTPVSNVVATHGQTSVAAAPLFTAFDMDGDTITKYAFWDREGYGHWTVNGVAQAALTEIAVDATNLSQVSYSFGSAPDTLFIRAFDGAAWGAWQQFTATPAPNTAPVVTVSNLTATHGQAPVAASSLFTTADADGDAITKYQFWDREGNGHWNINGVAQAAYTEIPVDAANLSQVSYTFGTAMDTLFIRAFDGITWSVWTPFTATPGPNTAPVVTAANVNTVTNQSLAATDLFSVTDADGDTIVKYAFWDTQGNGHWSIGGVAQANNSEISVNAANLSQVSYVAGSGTDQLFVRAYDGMAWGDWQPFTATAGTSAVVASGSTLELGKNFNGPVSFAGTTGTLTLNSSTTFAGTVAGMSGSDAIDFADISFATLQAPTFNGTSTSGTLTVSDGTHTASITLLGDYMASTFTTSSNGYGGTLVVDPPANNNSLLAQPQSA